MFGHKWSSKWGTVNIVVTRLMPFISAFPWATSYYFSPLPFPAILSMSPFLSSYHSFHLTIPISYHFFRFTVLSISPFLSSHHFFHLTLNSISPSHSSFHLLLFPWLTIPYHISHFCRCARVALPHSEDVRMSSSSCVATWRWVAANHSLFMAYLAVVKRRSWLKQRVWFMNGCRIHHRCLYSVS